MGHHNALIRIEVNQEMQAAILNLNDKEVLGTQTLRRRDGDTLQTNYAAVVSRQRLLKNVARRIMK